MRLIKRIGAIICALAILMSFAGCHKKGEIAITVGDVEFTSAYYMCALVMADSQAKNEVAEKLTDEEKTSGEVDYASKKIDGKKYKTWVKDTAIEELKKIAAYKTLCKQNKVELEKDITENAENYANYYWMSYGYQAILEPNGVSADTYKAYMMDAYYSSAYFEHVYGKGGEKEIAAADVESKLYENFEIVNIIEASFAELSEEEVTNIKTTFNKYMEDLNAGNRTFEEIYKEHNKVEDTEEEHNHEEEATDEEKELEPLDKYASIIGNKDTDYASEQFDTVKAMAVGEVKLVELEENAGIILFVKKDIKADPYYLENLDISVRHLIKGDEFDKEIEKFAKTLKLDENKYATGQFKVEKIVYPEQAQ